ncbi:MAG: class I SAM-dependent methyltransferase [Acidobacteria bacterium]|nr:class I SAM-dependent methyltransferase [Acidobacteriota bacterium]
MQEDAVARQRDYYKQTAARYNEAHAGDVEHVLALNFLLGVMDHFGFSSLLDVGAGTGRTLLQIRQKRPELEVTGIEPVESLRQVGYAQGMRGEELLPGDATALPFKDGSFDVVTEFAVLHHVKDSRAVISEMFRVARKGIFISDSNLFGQGRPALKFAKRVLSFAGLWPLARFINTRGKGYKISEGDGLFYPYSAFQDYMFIRKRCSAVHILNTSGEGVNAYAGATAIALLGIKK